MAGDLKFVAYLRTSTTDQTLGLDAQRAACEAFVAARSGRIVGCFHEHESGARSDRQQLDAALAHARDRGATLLVAKLDRLSRDVEFLARLLKGDVPLAFCDLPNADRLMVTVMAGVAEWERERISTRTREALAQRKAKGWIDDKGEYRPPGKLGFAGFGDSYKIGHARGVATVKADAQAFAERIAPHIAQARQAGAESLREIAEWLNMHDIEARRGGQWDASAVHRVLKRLEPAKK